MQKIKLKNTLFYRPIRSKERELCIKYQSKNQYVTKESSYLDKELSAYKKHTK